MSLLLVERVSGHGTDYAAEYVRYVREYEPCDEARHQSGDEYDLDDGPRPVLLLEHRSEQEQVHHVSDVVAPAPVSEHVGEEAQV